MAYRTDRQRVTGLGAAGHGVTHWWEQRLSAIALVILTPPFVFTFARTLGAGHEQVLATYAHPFHAVVAIAFILVVFLHLFQGLQVVIEDYVSNKRLETGLIVAARLLCGLTALTGVFAILKIALGA
jgi:succinate dehydrogenase / fumarate reductase, membrane anchor subunit